MEDRTLCTIIDIINSLLPVKFELSMRGLSVSETPRDLLNNYNMVSEDRPFQPKIKTESKMQVVLFLQYYMQFLHWS